MAAAIVVTPAEARVGQPVQISGSGWLAETVIDVQIPQYGLEIETKSDEAGIFAGDDAADRAVATLTSDATNVTANDTVTIDAVTYTFKASVTTTANEVLIGANAAASLANLKSAINLDGTAVYGSLTAVHPTVGAGNITATTLKLYAKTGGTAANLFVSTEASTHLSFGDTTFIDTGAVSTGISPLIFTPSRAEPFSVVAFDGTSRVTVTVRVWSS